MTNLKPEVKEVAQNIYLIDSEFAYLPRFTSAYLLNEDKKTLVDLGSPAAVPTILNGLKQIGVSPKDIAYIVLTHIHLDHAGGIGLLIREMPQVKILLHPKASSHLVDPSKLVSSSAHTQKGSPNEALRYDLTMPVALERIQEVEDNEEMSLGPEQKIKFIYAPGHTSHHICICEERNEGVFVGEAAGYLFDNIILPNTPPPSDLEAAFASLENLIALSPKALYFPHYGVNYKAKETLELARSRMKMWFDIVHKAVQKNPDKIMEELKHLVDTEVEAIEKVRGYEGIVARAMVLFSLNGYIDYFKSKSSLA